MTHSPLRSAAPRRFLAWGASLCIGLLLMTTIAQALDRCELAPLHAAHHFCTERPASGSTAVCLICVAGRTPSLAAPMTSVAAPGNISSVCGSIGQPLHSDLQMFGLHVRPPPSL